MTAGPPPLDETKVGALLHTVPLLGLIVAVVDGSTSGFAWTDWWLAAISSAMGLAGVALLHWIVGVGRVAIEQPTALLSFRSQLRTAVLFPDLGELEASLVMGR